MVQLEIQFKFRMIPTTSDLVTVRQSFILFNLRKYLQVENCMTAVTLNWPSYPEVGLVTLNLLSELHTKCGLIQLVAVSHFRS